MSKNLTKKVFVASSGTGGHLYPAQKLARLLLDKKIKPIFIGSGLKKNPFFHQEQFVSFEIASSSIRVKRFWPLLKALFLLGKGFFQAIWKIYKYKPDLVIGFGSFHTFPILLAARMLRRKIILYEPNRICGRVNRFFSKKAHTLVVHFPEVYAHKSKQVAQIPFFSKSLKEDTDQARKKMGLKQNLFTFFIFGGSQGSVAINQLFLKAAKELKHSFSFQVFHITGKNDSVLNIKKTYQELNIPSVVKEFEPCIHRAYLASDLVICRSGAMTVHELLAYEKASILIPYPYATENHQEINADYLVDDIQCACKMTEEKLKKESLAQKIKQIIQKKKIQTWQQQIAQLKADKFEKKDQTVTSFVDLIINETK